MKVFSKTLRFLKNNAALSVLLFSLRMLFAFVVYGRGDSDRFFYLISSFGLVHLMKLGNMPLFQEMYNNEKDKILYRNMAFYSAIEFILILYTFVIFSFDFKGYLLFVIIIARHFSDYLGFFFMTKQRLEFSRLVLISIEVILILLAWMDTFVYEHSSSRPSLFMFFPIVGYVMIRFKQWRYLVVDGLSSMMFSYDIFLIGLLNPSTGFISNFALLSRSLNIVPSIQSLFTEPYRLRDFSIAYLKHWNKILSVFGVVIILTVSIVAYFLVDINGLFIILITIFYILQVLSRSLKNHVVRKSLIASTVSLTVVAFTLFSVIVACAEMNNSIVIFLIAKIVGTLIFILGYVYLLRYRRWPEFS